MIKAPRGHTSVYFSDYLKANIAILHQVMNDKGFTSFNSFFNTVMVDAINSHDGKKTVKKPSVFDDSNLAFKEKLFQYSDGELYDILHAITEKREVMLKECQRRGMKI
jgi:hypothetical protein|tara:strand:+ start:220 stop:543 length:324 start_codon:yes stop_codon:yes gene_type:complete